MAFGVRSTIKARSRKLEGGEKNEQLTCNAEWTGCFLDKGNGFLKNMLTFIRFLFLNLENNSFVCYWCGYGPLGCFC